MPNDDKILDMDSVQYVWMYQSWLKDQEEEAEVSKGQACLIGSFTDPERAAKIMDLNNNSHFSSDEEFEESLDIVNSGKKFDFESLGFVDDSKPKKRRKKRRVVK